MAVEGLHIAHSLLVHHLGKLGIHHAAGKDHAQLDVLDAVLAEHCAHRGGNALQICLGDAVQIGLIGDEHRGHLGLVALDHGHVGLQNLARLGLLRDHPQLVVLLGRHGLVLPASTRTVGIDGAVADGNLVQWLAAVEHRPQVQIQSGGRAFDGLEVFLQVFRAVHIDMGGRHLADKFRMYAGRREQGNLGMAVRPPQEGAAGEGLAKNAAHQGISSHACQQCRRSRTC